MVFGMIRGAALLALSVMAATAQNGPLQAEVNSVMPDALALYRDLHEHPELSSHETQTAAKLAGRLRKLGYEVTEKVGGAGVVGVMKNGAGPTIMLRTEMDALPIEEQTGLPYASKVRAKDDSGRDVGVMQACGHDLHMSAWWATAAIMAKTKNTWRGTLVLIGQPAEETITGAKRMIADGLYARIPKPDAGLALHDSNNIAAGQVGIVPGYFNTAADSLRITLYGRGGHGSAPETTVDPIVMAASIVMRLQAIVSREVHAGDAAVITVGYIQAGTKNNIIPDTAEMGLTVRSRKPEVRKRLLDSIDRVVQAEAQASGAEKKPLIERPESTSVVYNDTELARHLTSVFESALGKSNVVADEPITASEDYSAFVEQGTPSLYFELGAADPQKLAEAKATGKALPSAHSALFAPAAEPALRTGIAVEVAGLRDLLKGTSADITRITEAGRR